MQWATSTATLTNTYLVGEAAVNTTTGVGGNGVILTGQFDITGRDVIPISINMPGTWGTGGSAGVYTASGGGDLCRARLSSTRLEPGFINPHPESRLSFFPEQTINLVNFGGFTYSGIMFDANTSGQSDVRQVQVGANIAGTSFTILPYANISTDNASTNTLDATFTDTITISSANSPAPGV